MAGAENSETRGAVIASQRPVVVQYLYVHHSGESFEYPSSRDRSGSPGRLAVRYLECVLVQAASLRLRGVDCDLVLVTNLTESEVLGKTGSRLLEEIEAMGVEIVIAEYEHRPAGEAALFAAARYLFDAIVAVAAREESHRPLWLMDVDCVWIDPAHAFAARPAPPAIGCVEIPYPLDWGAGHDRRSIGELARRMGAPDGPPPWWVGGELLAGEAGDLLSVVRACEAVEQELAALGEKLTTEEELLTLALALGRVRVEKIEHVARRIWTGPRHGAPPPESPAALALWHLPSEKGLGFRRAARQLGAGHGDRLMRDLEEPQRALRRFNVEGAGRLRRLHDDLWLLRERAVDAARARLGT